MPYGTNEKKTDSLISFVESKVIEAGKELEEIYMKNDERNLIEYINKNIGLSADNMSMIVGFGDVGGSSTASLEVYMLDSEKRPQSLRASMLAKLIREKTGEIVGAEKFIVNDAANFGGSFIRNRVKMATHHTGSLRRPLPPGKRTPGQCRMRRGPRRRWEGRR